MTRPGGLAADPRFAAVGLVRHAVDEARAWPLDDGIWSLRMPLGYPVSPSVNAVLLETADGWCLVDCGSSIEPGWAGLARALELAGVTPGDVSLLVTTHGHSDHAGLAATVIERTGCSYARLDAPATMTERLRGAVRPHPERRREALEQGIPEELVEVWIGSHVGGDGLHVVPPAGRLLREGDALATRSGEWAVLAAPGHNASQLMLWNEAKGWLISADVALKIPVPYVEWGHTADPFADHLASLRRARALGARLLLPGHGRPVADTAEHVDCALEAALTYRDRVIEALAAGPATPFVLLERLVPDDADLDYRQAGFSTLLSVLDHLELRGLAASEPAADGLRIVRETV